MPKTILFAHQKGGVGKSTIALNLAISLCKHSKVAIVDLDHQGSLLQLKSKFEQFDISNNKNLLKRNKEYDFIIIDTSPYLSHNLPDLFRLADLIVIPTKAGILDVLAITSTIDLIKQEKMQSKALIVFNMVKPNTTLTGDILKTLEPFDINVAKNKLSDLVAFTRSVILNGVSYNANAQSQLDNLTKEILTLLL